LEEEVKVTLAVFSGFPPKDAMGGGFREKIPETTKYTPPPSSDSGVPSSEAGDLCSDAAENNCGVGAFLCTHRSILAHRPELFSPMPE
jgi:hypothetical protein